MNFIKSLNDQAKQLEDELELQESIEQEDAETSTFDEFALSNYFNQPEIDEEDEVLGEWFDFNASKRKKLKKRGMDYARTTGKSGRIKKNIKAKNITGDKKDETEDETEDTRESIISNEENRIDEFFGQKKDKEREARARKYAQQSGKSSRYQKNIDAKISGGKDNSGRLEQLNKEFGVAQFDQNGKLPKHPEGMNPADYEIWVQMLLAKLNSNKTDLGPSIGPSRGDIIRAKGKSFIIVDPEAAPMVVSAKDKDGNMIKVKWADLPKATELEGKKVYQ